MRAILSSPKSQSAAASLAEISRAWRESTNQEPSLFVASARDEAALRGAFQYGDEGLVVRGSGGGTVLVGPGRVWLSLALPRANALIPDASPDKILNRYVRPLLRALTKISSVPVSYFGRDWISAGKRPVGFVGFAHDASSGRALFEAVVGVGAPFSAGSPSFMGKEPSMLSEIAGKTISDHLVIESLVSAYFGQEISGTGPGTSTSTAITRRTGSLLASCPTAMGSLSVYVDSNGLLFLGGELMASSDAIARLEEGINSLPPSASADSIGALVDSSLTEHGAIVFGIRSLGSIRDLILAARTSLAERSRT